MRDRSSGAFSAAYWVAALAASLGMLLLIVGATSVRVIGAILAVTGAAAAQFLERGGKPPS